MHVILTLSVAGTTIASRTIAHDPVRLSCEVGQAAWKLYGEAGQKGFPPIDTTLTDTKGEDDMTDLAKRTA